LSVEAQPLGTDPTGEVSSESIVLSARLAPAQLLPNIVHPYLVFDLDIAGRKGSFRFAIDYYGPTDEVLQEFGHSLFCLALATIDIYKGDYEFCLLLKEISPLVYERVGWALPPTAAMNNVFGSIRAGEDIRITIQ
jgi:hypothetical protein